MVWENGCTVIVMMTALVEDGEKQCERYWPDEGSSLYNIYEVRNIQFLLPWKSLMAFTLFYLFFLVCLRWILCPNTSGVKTSWFVVSTWRTFRLKRRALWPSFICWAGLHKASPPPHVPCWLPQVLPQQHQTHSDRTANRLHTHQVVAPQKFQGRK